MGIWRMQPGPSNTALLSYSLYVKPQQWLPVGLISNRIEREVGKNLEAVRKYSEEVYNQTLSSASE